VGKACSTNDEKRDAFRIMAEKPEERQLRRPRREWVDIIIIMCLRDTLGC
jgi:hypothetical protein